MKEEDEALTSSLLGTHSSLVGVGGRWTRPPEARRMWAAAAGAGRVPSGGCAGVRAVAGRGRQGAWGRRVGTASAKVKVPGILGGAAPRRATTTGLACCGVGDRGALRGEGHGSGTGAGVTRALRPWRGGRGVPLACEASAGAGHGPSGEERAEVEAQLDLFIDAMVGAGSEREVAGLVGKNLPLVGAELFLRIASRADDVPEGSPTRDRLADLAGKVVTLAEEAVAAAESTLDDRAGMLQEVVAAAAEANGEFMVPLERANVERLRVAMEDVLPQCDEGFLQTATAWMKKAGDDGLPGMVEIVQKVLQVWAALSLAGVYATPDEPASDLLETILATDERDWEDILSSRIGGADGPGGAVPMDAFLAAVQAKLEGQVLALPSGSLSQKVQAEYLIELMERVKTIAAA